MGSFSVWHWIIVAIVVLLFFGKGKISELMGDMAHGIKAFKKGMQDEPDVAAPKTEPVKTLASPLAGTGHTTAGSAAAAPGLVKRADTETRVEGSTL